MTVSLKAAVALGIVVVCLVACASAGTPGGADRSSSPRAPTTQPTPAASPRPTPTPIAVLPGEPWIAYSWDRRDGYGWKLYLVRPDGSDNHQIMDTLPGEQRAPAWSPDGTKLAFVNIDPADPTNPDSSIWIANADGSDPQRFFDQGDQCGIAFHPSWSPDGTKLALICYFGTDSASVAVLDVGSMALATLVKVAWPEFMDDPPRWSPDGTSIAFDIIKWDPTNTFEVGSVVATVPAMGGKVKQLTSFDTFMAHPDWRPDGSELVMNSYDLGNASDLDEPSNLYSIRPDGTGLRQLTHSSVDGSMRIGQPRWDAEGNRILVSIMNFTPGEHNLVSVHLAFVDPVGGEPTVISAAFDGKYADIRQTP